MAPLALLYDVHGNLAALGAVLDDARAQGAARFLLGGDYALFGPSPQETVAALRELPEATWIRGNGERWTAFPGQAPDDPVVQGAIAACRESLGSEAVSELAGLPESAADDGVLYCHGSPPSDVRSWRPVVSSWSTRAAWGCRSTATRAPPMRWWRTTARSSTAGSPTTTSPPPPPFASASPATGHGPSAAASSARRSSRPPDGLRGPTRLG
jgi:hypothetical protein